MLTAEMLEEFMKAYKLYLQAKPCRKGLVSGLYLKEKTMAVCSPTEPYHHISISKQGVKSIFSGNCTRQYNYWKLTGPSCQEL